MICGYKKIGVNKYCFSNKVVNTWNSLSKYVVSANTANTFKTRVDNFWQSQDIVHDFKAQIHGTGTSSEL